MDCSHEVSFHEYVKALFIPFTKPRCKKCGKKIRLIETDDYITFLAFIIWNAADWFIDVHLKSPAIRYTLSIVLLLLLYGAYIFLSYKYRWYEIENLKRDASERRQ